jgi:hypothetical protein
MERHERYADELPHSRCDEVSSLPEHVISGHKYRDHLPHLTSPHPTSPSQWSYLNSRNNSQYIYFLTGGRHHKQPTQHLLSPLLPYTPTYLPQRALHLPPLLPMNTNLHSNGTLLMVPAIVLGSTHDDLHII